MPAPTVSTEPLFTEEQGFLRSWWGLLVGVAVLLAAVTLLLLLLPRHAVPLVAKLLPPGTFLLVAGLFAALRLYTRLDAQGISYRMRPLGWQRLAWADVRRAYVRTYSPLGEYGGWGIKGFSLKNRALNVAGSQGLQLELADGRRLLLGTQRPAELRQALAKLPPGGPASAT